MTKYEYFSDLWAQGDVFVAVALKHPGVVVPDFVRAQDKETETFVLGMTPTPKLTTDSGGIIAPMRFNQYFFDCYFPWDSIFAVVNNDVQIAFRPTEGGATAPRVVPTKKKAATSKPADNTRKITPLRRVK